MLVPLWVRLSLDVCTWFYARVWTGGLEGYSHAFAAYHVCFWWGRNSTVWCKVMFEFVWLLSRLTDSKISQCSNFWPRYNTQIQPQCFEPFKTRCKRLWGYLTGSCTVLSLIFVWCDSVRYSRVGRAITWRPQWSYIGSALWTRNVACARKTQTAYWNHFAFPWQLNH